MQNKNSAGRLLSRYTQTLPAGKLTWIGLRPARKADMLVVEQTQALENQGLEGDRRCKGTPGSARQVSIISEEYIQQINHFLNCHRAAIDPNLVNTITAIPELLRRNLVVSGVNLTAIRHQRIRIGEAEFETTALCHPCLRMEQAFGDGGVAAMLGHGGLCAKIVKSGLIKVGDTVSLVKPLDLFS